LFEHLQGHDGNAPTSLAARSANAIAHGYPSIDSGRLALAQLAEAGRQQAETLSYADAFGFMAVIAVIAVCLVPIIPPTPVVRK
jgi:DHA2 family multidrug resistance protein